MLPTYLVPKWQFYSETPKKLWKIGLGLPENCLELNIDITKYIQTAPPIAIQRKSFYIFTFSHQIYNSKKTILVFLREIENVIGSGKCKQSI